MNHESLITTLYSHSAMRNWASELRSHLGSLASSLHGWEIFWKIIYKEIAIIRHVSKDIFQYQVSLIRGGYSALQTGTLHAFWCSQRILAQNLKKMAVEHRCSTRFWIHYLKINIFLVIIGYTKIGQFASSESPAPLSMCVFIYVYIYICALQVETLS